MMEKNSEPRPVEPYVVAIGASAGGLDALERLFDGLTADSGSTFVVIQHLSPDHKSMMANLLSRHSDMPVVMVEQDMPIQANFVYLIPPGAIMQIDAGYLRLTPKAPKILTLPIDIFFTSMAAQYGPRSVGVILSGTGSDGTRGSTAINDAGGFLIAQEPENAKFDGMPRSVIATGLVDAILPVEAIGPRILAHIQNAPALVANVLREPSGRATALSPEAAMAGILHMLMQLGGIDFQEYKPGTVMRRIERRMTVRQVSSLESYLALPSLLSSCLTLPCLAFPSLLLPCLTLPCLAFPSLLLTCLTLPCLPFPSLLLPCLPFSRLFSLSLLLSPHIPFPSLTMLYFIFSFFFLSLHLIFHLLLLFLHSSSVLFHLPSLHLSHHLPSLPSS